MDSFSHQLFINVSLAFLFIKIEVPEVLQNIIIQISVNPLANQLAPSLRTGHNQAPVGLTMAEKQDLLDFL